MKCPKCKGSGMMDVDDGIFTIHGYDCDYCLGTGYIEPMTNEEWFCGLSTTEKSEFLAKMFQEAVEVHDKHGVTWHESVIWWDGWLKQPYKGE